MQSSDEQIARGRRSARLKLSGIAVSFCVAGLCSIVASLLVILEEKDLDENDERKVEIIQYGGLCGGTLAMFNAVFFGYVLIKIPNTDGLTQMMTKQCYIIIALILPYVGGAVGVYFATKPLEDEKLQSTCYVVAAGFAIVVFSTFSYLRFMWMFSRAFGVHLCKCMEEDKETKQPGRNDSVVYTVGMS